MFMQMNTVEASRPLQQWLLSLPEISLKRLRTINLATSSSSHIVLTLTFGLYDEHIRRLNRMITSLLLARLRAQRAGKTRVVNRINNFMNEVHESIDFATGTTGLRKSSEETCGRPALPAKG